METKVPNFYLHIWKRFTRSARFKTNLVGRIFIGFAFLLMLVQAGAFSYFFIDIFEKEAPQESPVDLFSSGLFYALLIFLIMRLFLQRQSSLSVRPYLHLPIKRNTLVKFILFDSALTFFNTITLVLILPLFFRAVLPQAGGLPALSWLLSFSFLMIFTNYLAAWFRFQLSNNLTVVSCIILIVIGLGLLEYVHIISLTGLSQAFFTMSLFSPWPLLFSILLAAAIIAVNLHYLKSNMYLNISPKKTSKRETKQSSMIENPQLFKELLKLEFRLQMRNKRTRANFLSFMLMPLVFVVGIILPHSTHSAWNYYVPFFIIGSFTLLSGMYLLGYESAFFDKLLTLDTSLKQYYRFKWRLYSISCILIFIVLLIISFVMIKANNITSLFASLIFNLGVTTSIILFISLIDPKYFDLGTNLSYNFQGRSYKEVLWGLEMILFMILYHMTINSTGYFRFDYILIGLGTIFLLLTPFTLRLINFLLIKRKYFIAERIREGRY
jgi:hypothetical protein